MKKKLAAISAVLAVSMFGTLALAGCGDKQKTLQLEDGSTYVGYVKDGAPEGEGTLTNTMGSEWKGNFVGGKLQGLGTYYSYDGDEYEGFFKDGVFSGYGHMTSVNGDEFWGMFENGKRNGVGRMEYTTACVYEGGWQNNYMHGMGWMTWPVGDVYFGEWNNGDPTGMGCKLFYDAAFSKKGDYTTYNMYTGKMVKNLMEGWGIMYFAETGGIYVGNWEGGIRSDAHATYYFESAANEVKFEGAFSKEKNNGWIWGEGTMWYADGRVVTGVWEGTQCVEEKSVTLQNASAAQQEAQSAKSGLFEHPLVQSAQSVIG
jgi:hypothetical protein